MIGPSWRSKAAQSLLGPYRSSLVPAVLWIGWLDENGDLIAMSGLSVSHDAFGPTEAGVANTATVDCGVAGEGWTIAALGLFDAAAGGNVIVSAALPAPVSPSADAPLSFAVGALTFEVA